MKDIMEGGIRVIRMLNMALEIGFVREGMEDAYVNEQILPNVNALKKAGEIYIEENEDLFTDDLIDKFNKLTVVNKEVDKFLTEFQLIVFYQTTGVDIDEKDIPLLYEIH